MGLNRKEIISRDTGLAPHNYLSDFVGIVKLTKSLGKGNRPDQA